ncbi:FEZ1 protein, partial [Nothocercus nigrocapillus]|nr:FEZ1 protein [Nothocercus nigrocapillus]
MEAPLVSLEEEFEEGPGGDGGGGGPPRGPADPALAELESFSAEMMSFKSMEDLVQEFDEKLTVCFRNYDAATEALAPVRGRLQAQEEEERLQDEEVWDALTDTFVPPGSPRRWLLPDTEAPSDSDTQDEDDEEEELTERSEQDSGINEEPLLTAEQVIEELEELMQSSPDPEADPEAEDEEEEEETETELVDDSGGTEPIVLRELRAFSPALNNNCSHEGTFLGAIPGRSGKKKHRDRDSGHVETRRWTRPRRQDHEMRMGGTKTGAKTQGQGCGNQDKKPRRRHGAGDAGGDAEGGPGHRFPQRFSMEGISSILQSGIRHTFGSGTADKQYLNTVIPYEKKGSPPSVEDLQMLTNILFAMKEGNEKVPTLLTDYILKGNDGG